MKKRILTGAVYVVVVLATFLLREFVDYRLFDLLTFFWMVAGTFEVARAVRSWAVKGNFATAIVFSGASVALYALLTYICGSNLGGLAVVALTALFLLYTAIVCLKSKQNGKTFIISALPFVYPTLFL